MSHTRSPPTNSGASPYTPRVGDGYASGRIDLVFREGGELVVADWESDAVGIRIADPHTQTSARLLALERDEFVGAATGHAASVEAADAVMTARLSAQRLLRAPF